MAARPASPGRAATDGENAEGLGVTINKTLGVVARKSSETLVHAFRARVSLAISPTFVYAQVTVMGDVDGGRRNEKGFFA